MATLVDKTVLKINDGSVIAVADQQLLDSTNGNEYIWDQFTALMVVCKDAGGITLNIASDIDSSGKSKTITMTLADNDLGVVNLLDNGFQIGGKVTVTSTGATNSTITPVKFSKP